MNCVYSTHITQSTSTCLVYIYYRYTFCIQYTQYIVNLYLYTVHIPLQCTYITGIHCVYSTHSTQSTSSLVCTQYSTSTCLCCAHITDTESIQFIVQVQTIYIVHIVHSQPLPRLCCAHITGIHCVYSTHSTQSTSTSSLLCKQYRHIE